MGFAAQDRKPVEYLAWFNRVFGWDAALPLLVSAGAIIIARTLKHQPPADILALTGLPALAFSLRLIVGVHQIKGNACDWLMRSLQFAALLVALFVLAFVDFFIALAAFVPQAGARQAGEFMPVWAASLITYLTLVTFAMYPGRQATGTLFKTAGADGA